MNLFSEHFFLSNCSPGHLESTSDEGARFFLIAIRSFSIFFRLIIIFSKSLSRHIVYVFKTSQKFFVPSSKKRGRAFFVFFLFLKIFNWTRKRAQFSQLSWRTFDICSRTFTQRLRKNYEITFLIVFVSKNSAQHVE